MFDQEFMRNALLAGTFVALACGCSGWFVVLRAQVFAGDALSHVAFPGALAAAAAGIDERVGLFAATVLVGVGHRHARGRARRRASGGSAAQDTAIGIVFTFVLGLGVFFLTLFGMSAGGGSGIQAAHTLFGSIYGLGGGEARVAAAVALAATVGVLAIARPLLFVSLAADVAAARGVPARALSVGFLALLGVVAAGATQAVGALLLLGLLTGPAAAAHRLTGRPYVGIALAGMLAVGAMWGGLALSYAVPRLPPSTAIVALAVGEYAVAAFVDAWKRRRSRRPRDVRAGPRHRGRRVSMRRGLPSQHERGHTDRELDRARRGDARRRRTPPRGRQARAAGVARRAGVRADRARDRGRAARQGKSGVW